jgi:ABC-type molybdenum transport system ATPase subunit/photorepair protein PhrA
MTKRVKNSKRLPHFNVLSGRQDAALYVRQGCLTLLAAGFGGLVKSPHMNRAATTPILTVTGLSVRRGRTTILREVSWRVQRGEHWVILGANGSGKTSLLSALTGYLMPTSGVISVLGET